MQHVRRLCGSWLQARILLHSRLYSSFVPPHEQQSKPLDSTPGTEPSVRTLRSRSHGNKALPISALFDPVTVSARRKHKEPKASAPGNPADLTDFQRELSQNAYAHALVTPVRTCVLTKARLPAHFLIPFVTDTPPKTDTIVQSSDTEHEQDVVEPNLKPILSPRIGEGNGRGKSPSSYILASHSSISHLVGTPARKRSRGVSKWTMLVNERMRKFWDSRSGKNLAKPTLVAKEWEWDDGMAEVVRGKLGSEVVRSLERCLQQEEQLFGKALGVGESAAVVRIGGEEAVAATSNMYDLRDMVDEALLGKLRELSGGVDEIVLKKHTKTWSTHAALEKLRNYVQGNKS